MADSGCLKAAGIVMISLSAAGVLGFAAVVAFGTLAPGTGRTPPTTLRERAAETNRRLFLEEIRWLDSTRKDVFRSTLVKAGERCDRVTSSVMRRPGVWAVGCDPGHVFVFKFDEQGSLIEASKLR